jgi:hypothetical protein
MMVAAMSGEAVAIRFRVMVVIVVMVMMWLHTSDLAMARFVARRLRYCHAVMTDW